MSGVALIQGASRGLGLQFCRHILQHNKSQVIATCRNPGSASALTELQQQFPDRLSILQIDVTKEEEILSASKNVKTTHGKIDLMLNCAAVLHPSGRGETSLASIKPDELQTVYATNAVGPLLMVKHFKPLLLKGQGLFGAGKDNSPYSSIVANISARVSSITDNGLGGWYAYRMSKVALNMATKNISIELGRGKSKVVCVVLHPGTVETDLSRPYHNNVPKDKLFTAEYSVNCLMNVISKLDSNQSGKFFAFDGSNIPF